LSESANGGNTNSQNDADSGVKDNSALVDSDLNVVPKLNDLKAAMDAKQMEESETVVSVKEKQSQEATEDEDDICWDDLDL
jgi:hypothetical protein